MWFLAHLKKDKLSLCNYDLSVVIVGVSVLSILVVCWLLCDYISKIDMHLNFLNAQFYLIRPNRIVFTYIG